jgi:hypothetical protein
VNWKLKRASKGYDPHPHIRYGARPTEQDGQISALSLPMSVLVFDARPDQEDETVYVVRSCAWFPPEMPYAWLPLQDFTDLLRWRDQLKAGVGREDDMPTKKLPPIQGFYHDLHLPGPKWRFSAFEQWML